MLPKIYQNLKRNLDPFSPYKDNWQISEKSECRLNPTDSKGETPGDPRFITNCKTYI